MKIGTQEFGDEITGRWKIPRISLTRRKSPLDSVSYMSSSGEMKISLKLMTFVYSVHLPLPSGGELSYVFMAQVL